MSTMACDPTVPMSSGEIRTIDPERGLDVEQKHLRVADFLRADGFDALLLQHPDNFSWFTTGGDCTRGGMCDATAALFVTPDARVVLTNNVDSGEMFDWQLSGLGFQLKERPWQEPRQVLIEDLCRGRSVCTDVPMTGATCIAEELTELRMPVPAFECRGMRELGRRVAHAVEATARNFLLGQSEAEVAGQLAHRLLKHEIQPARLQVWADSQGHRYRHWAFSNERVERYCVITAIGRRSGLHVAASRTVCFDEPSEQIREAHQRCQMIQAAGMHFSRVGWKLRDTWSRVQRIYEKFGHPDEWRQADQAELIGYRMCEAPLRPESELELTPRMALFWHPSVGPAMVGDTILIAGRGVENITPAQDWPTTDVEVKGVRIACPDILRRNA